jgi:hypothetical protein
LLATSTVGSTCTGGGRGIVGGGTDTSGANGVGSGVAIRAGGRSLGPDLSIFRSISRRPLEGPWPGSCEDMTPHLGRRRTCAWRGLVSCTCEAGRKPP